MGRLTLNPVAHIDPVMTILVPVVLVATTGFAFGGAKPVPVSYHRLRSPLRDMMFVALAGPISNVLLAFVFGFAFYACGVFLDMDTRSLAMRVLAASIQFNLILAVFNMIPIPPLDGSRVLAFFLPRDLREPYVRLETFGMLIVFGLLMTGTLSAILSPAVSWGLGVVNSFYGAIFY